MDELTSSSELWAIDRLRLSIRVELERLRVDDSPHNSSKSTDDEPLSDISDEEPRTDRSVVIRPEVASATAIDDGPLITSSSSSELC